MAHIDKDDLDILRSVFNRYDKSRTGSLSSSEFVLFLTRLGKHVKELEQIGNTEIISVAKAVFALFDKDCDGRMTFDEFCLWFNSSENCSYFTGEKAFLLRKAYDLYTSASSGRMTHSQFNDLLDKLGIEHTEYDFDALDNDEDGLLSFSEFCNWLNWF
jgi:Ca2+-binding EF-hand superfamily protein